MSGRSSNDRYGSRLVPEKIGDSLIRLDKTIEDYADDDVYLMSFTVKTTHQRGGEYLLVARIETGGAKYVAFHNADSVYDVLQGFANRFVNRQLKLKEDQYG